MIERVAERELELGVVGALRRHRSLVFEPLARDEIVLAVPPGHPLAGGEISLEALREETLIVMQEGAGVRQVVEEELRRAGLRLAASSPGWSSACRSRSRAPSPRATASPSSRARRSRASSLPARSPRRGSRARAARQLYVVRAKGRPPTRAAEAFVEFAREHAA